MESRIFEFEIGEQRQTEYASDFAEACYSHIPDGAYEEYFMENDLDMVVVTQDWYHLGIRDITAAWFASTVNQDGGVERFLDQKDHLFGAITFPIASKYDLESANHLFENSDGYIYCKTDARSMIPLVMGLSNVTGWDDYRLALKLDEWYHEKLYEVAADWFHNQRNLGYSGLVDVDEWYYDKYNTNFEDGVDVKFTGTMELHDAFYTCLVKKQYSFMDRFNMDYFIDSYLLR